MNGNHQDLTKKISTYWPIIVTILAITVTAAQANTRLDNLNDRVQYIYTNGSPTTQERLVRIETQQIELSRTLDRVEDKLDKDLTVSDGSRKRLKNL